MNTTEFTAKLKRTTEEFCELIRSEGKHVSNDDILVEIGLEAIELQATGSDYNAYCLLNHNIDVWEWHIDPHE